MNNGSGIYVLCSDPCDHHLTGTSCYSSHGTFHGEDNVVGSSKLSDARLFTSLEEAEIFRKRELPQWARRKFRAVEVSGYQLLLAQPMEYAEALGRAFQMELARQMNV